MAFLFYCFEHILIIWFISNRLFKFMNTIRYFGYTLFFIFLAFSSCNKKNNVVTPFEYASTLWRCLYMNDSLSYVKYIETASLCHETMILTKMNSGRIYDSELKLINMPGYDSSIRSIALNNFSEVQDSFSKLGVSKQYVVDSIEFRNYIDVNRPYFCLDVDAYLSNGFSVYILKIRHAILLIGGWYSAQLSVSQSEMDRELLKFGNSNTAIVRKGDLN